MYLQTINSTHINKFNRIIKKILLRAIVKIKNMRIFENAEANEIRIQECFDVK